MDKSLMPLNSFNEFEVERRRYLKDLGSSGLSNPCGICKLGFIKTRPLIVKRDKK